MRRTWPGYGIMEIMDGQVPGEPTALMLTALPVEMAAVLAHMDPGTSEMAGPVLCEIRHFTASNGLTWRVAVVELGPGTIDTAAAVVKVGTAFRPQVLMFVGIAGALKDEVAIGDVVAGTEVAWTERGKWSDASYLPRIRTVSLSTPLSQWARKIARDGSWTARLRQPRSNVRAFVQQIASCEKVVADQEYRSWLRATFSDAYAIENEGFALARAGEVYTDGERYVIRGISDTADGNKSDVAHQSAADAAAAFAFELLDAYSGAQATLTSSTAMGSSDRAADNGRGLPIDEQVSDLSALGRDLIHDVDLLDDDRGRVEDLARRVADHGDDSGIHQLISDIGSALEENNGALITRRLVWFGRQLLRSAGTRLFDWQLETAVKIAPAGMASLLTDPAVWGRCPYGARRRSLTALLGPPDPPRPTSQWAIGLIAPLQRAGVFNDIEAARVQASFNLTPFDHLVANGVMLDMLVPRLVADLKSGDSSHQNAAARFFYNLPPALANQPIHPSLDFSLGAALVEATVGAYHSFGADEAMAWPYISTWTPSRLAGGIWAAVTCVNGQLLRIQASQHLPMLIAAAAGTSKISEILGTVNDKLDSILREIPIESVRTGEDVLDLAGNYVGDDHDVLISFGERLRRHHVSDPRE